MFEGWLLQRAMTAHANDAAVPGSMDIVSGAVAQSSGGGATKADLEVKPPLSPSERKFKDFEQPAAGEAKRYETSTLYIFLEQFKCS